jgi:Uncharacterized protein conserved in bacteria
MNDLQSIFFSVWLTIKPHSLYIAVFLIMLILFFMFGGSKKRRSGRRGQTDKVHHKAPAEELKTFRDLSYRPPPLMTEAEINFFIKLQMAFPGYFIFPQIGGSALVGIESKPFNRYHFFSALNWIDTARVDFTLCDPQCRVVALIELDDSSHDDRKERDEARDYIYRCAGYRLFRFDCRRMPDSERIRATILRQGAG